MPGAYSSKGATRVKLNYNRTYSQKKKKKQAINVRIPVKTPQGAAYPVPLVLKVDVLGYYNK